MTNLNDKKRLKIGLLFDLQKVWMGGITYILNLIKTLNYLDEDDKPEIILFYSSELKEFLEEIDYPYIKFVEKEPYSVVKGYLSSWLTRQNKFIDDYIKRYDLDTIYPVRDCPVKSKAGAHVMSWYADLQHKYFPEFFTKKVIIHRTFRLNYMLKNADKMVVSSQAVKDDFDKFFNGKKIKFDIYHFISINEDYQILDIDSLRTKYNLPEKYFMVSNQFHKHKNHKVVLLALAQLKDKGVKKHLAFTGRFPSAANSPYLAELHGIIERYGLKDQISLLGIIPRSEQIQLMNHCQAIIQPSLFEGWSTVIEDAISLQVPVMASNIKVNMEQLQDKGAYFDPHKPEELAGKLELFADRNMDEKLYEEHHIRIKKAANNLLEVFKG